jgi:ABC-type bacteriocin/lantibiotic exporter with double-glycine peptidase domain
MPSSIILPVRHLQQRDRGDCLAACAAISLGHLGILVPYERLLKLLRIKQPIGTPAFNIRNLEKLGVRVIYEQGTLKNIHTYLTCNLPCIAFVKTNELPYWDESGDHAVVVVGLDSHYVYLNDPAFADAPIQISHGDFDLAWLERDEFYAVLMR